MSDHQVMTMLTEISGKLDRLLAGAAPSGAAVASDADLDSPYGDEIVKLDPKGWHGPSMKGQPMSQCPALFLEQLAGLFDFFAKKNAGVLTDKGKPKSDFDRRSAARARGWAARARLAGHVGTNTAPDTDEDLGF